MTETKALAKPSDLAQLIPIGRAVRQVDLAPLAQRINLLGPRSMVYAGDGMRLRPVFVQLSQSPDDGDVYPAPSGQGKVALTKQGLLKLAEAKGVIWSDAHSKRVDDAPPCEACTEKAADTGRKVFCPHNVGFKAVCAWLDAAGQWQPHYATRYWCYDEELAEVERVYRKQLADGKIKADQVAPKVRDEFNKRYKDRLALAETKAKLRAIREIGVKAAYAPAELARGFLALRTEPDISDEEAKRRGMASAAQIFGPVLDAASFAALPAPDFEHAVDSSEGADDGEEKPAALPTGTQSVESEWPTDKEGPAERQDCREEVCSEVLRLWGVAEKAVSDGRIEQMPPAPPAQDAPLPELQEWCDKCAGFVGAMTEAGGRAEADSPAENGADAPTDTPAAEPTIGDLKNRILKMYGERGLNGPAQQKLLAQWADLRSIKPAPKVLSAGPMNDPALVADYLAFLTAGAGEGTTA